MWPWNERTIHIRLQSIKYKPRFLQKKKKKKYKPRDIQKRSHEGLQETKKVSFWSWTQLLLLANMILMCKRSSAHLSYEPQTQLANHSNAAHLYVFIILTQLKAFANAKIFSVLCLNFLSESISYDLCNEDKILSDESSKSRKIVCNNSVCGPIIILKYITSSLYNQFFF